MPDSDQPHTAKTSKPAAIPEWLTGIAAPAILIGAATAYFAGTVYHDRFFEQYGLVGSGMQWSVQQTIAYGYFALLRTILPTTIFAIIVMAIIFSVVRSKPPADTRDQRSKFDRRSYVLLRGAYLSALFASVGLYAGTTTAHVKYREVEEKISAHCISCFIYKTSRGQVIGIVVGQDDKSIVIVTRRGVAVLPAGAIKAVSALNRRTPVSRWWIL